MEIEHSKRRLAALENRKEELHTLKQQYQNLQIKRRLVKTHLKHMKTYAPVSGTVLTRDVAKCLSWTYRLRYTIDTRKLDLLDKAGLIYWPKRGKIHAKKGMQLKARAH